MVYNFSYRKKKKMLFYWLWHFLALCRVSIGFENCGIFFMIIYGIKKKWSKKEEKRRVLGTVYGTAPLCWDHGFMGPWVLGNRGSFNFYKLLNLWGPIQSFDDFGSFPSATARVRVREVQLISISSI